MTKQIGNARNDSRQPRLQKDPAKKEKDQALREWAKNNGVSLAVVRQYFKEEEEAEEYKYEWTTAEEIVNNINTKMKFPGWGAMTLVTISDTDNTEEFIKAHELWLKLKDAFNAEAATYNPEAYNSPLGSICKVERREVMRSAWWKTLEGEKYGDYSTLTRIIEALHHGEKLETGEILFGS